MPSFAGIDHLALTVTDLDRSERFYSEIIGLKPMVDFGTVRILIDRPSGFMLALNKHDAASGAPFSEVMTGLDHVGFEASSRDELVEWERRFDELGVRYTPIRDEPFGSHLIFRDPDNIALEFSASNELFVGWLEELRVRDVSQEEIHTRVTEYLASLQ